MAGGITDLGAFSAGTPLDVVTGGGGLGGLLSAGVAASNPYMAGLQALSSIFGGTKVKISQSGASGQAGSGYANFGNDDVIGMNKRLIDFSDVKSVVIAGVVLFGAIYAIKKIKRF